MRPYSDGGGRASGCGKADRLCGSQPPCGGDNLGSNNESLKKAIGPSGKSRKISLRTPSGAGQPRLYLRKKYRYCGADNCHVGRRRAGGSSLAPCPPLERRPPTRAHGTSCSRLCVQHPPPAGCGGSRTLVAATATRDLPTARPPDLPAARSPGTIAPAERLPPPPLPSFSPPPAVCHHVLLPALPLLAGWSCPAGSH